jgi:Cu(I)/Ag(I) efflux system membrane protein CusA/SilA
MIESLIRASLGRRTLVAILSLVLAAWSAVTIWRTPVDAIPDLSDVQVIVRASWPGQTPQVVEDQLTYPLTTTLLGLPKAKIVRGYSLFGDAFVYVIFEDGTDLYWARSRVLEALSGLEGRLPTSARLTLGPDATGVGWVYQYALVDRSGRTDLGHLRELQDYFLALELKSVPGVAEVASLGGMVRQLTVELRPDRMRALGIGLEQITAAIARDNGASGGAAIELGETEVMVRELGWVRTPAELAALPVRLADDATPVTLGDVANVNWQPAMRRGIGELDGAGEVAGGIVVMRTGENALKVIEAVEQRLAELKRGLPEGVEIVTTYDRSTLIGKAIRHMSEKLAEEFLMVALVCALFLMHLRSALVAIVCLPLGVGAAFIAMYALGIPANLMSLGGIAIAIGTMVDASVVTVENVHKHIEAHRHRHGCDPDRGEHATLVAQACVEVGPALFFSLLVVTVSFLPVFALEAQEGRLFQPLAWTKTFSMAAAALLSVTLIPVLCLLFTRSGVRDEQDNPLNRWMIAAYLPLLRGVLAWPRATLVAALLVLLATAWPASRLGTEFLPPLDEGDLLYMPSALPGLSPQKAAELLQFTDRVIKSFPEVASVHGKAGRAETATDPAPLEMFETVIQLKPPAEWRPGLTMDALVAEMDAALQIPGLRNVWVQPIRNRIDMLATGVKSPVALKISGPDLATIERIGEQAAGLIGELDGVASVFAERVQGGRYIDVRVDPLKAAQAGITPGEVRNWIAQAVGGMAVGEVVDGRARFPIALRLPRELRDSLADLRALPIVRMDGRTLTLDQVASVEVVDGPAMIRTEQARPAGFVYIDVRGRDLGGFVAEARDQVAAGLELPPGYSLAWAGQYEYLERATERLSLLLPITLALIIVLLLGVFPRLAEVGLVLASLPFALVGGVWLLWALDHNVSVASAVGFIALGGLAAEFGVVMLVYLDQAVARSHGKAWRVDEAALKAAIEEGAALRVRPKAMTVITVLAGLAPVMLGHAPGAEAMQRIAAPMLGGMLSAPILSMLVVPAAYLLVRRRTVRLDARQLPARQ